MPVGRDEANALLSEVEGIESRVRQLLIYSHVSHYLLLWGVIWAIGFTTSYFFNAYAGLLWLVLQTLGLIGTIIIVAAHRRQRGTRNTFMIVRAGITVVATVAFGTLWIVLAHMGWREQVTFWPTLLSFMLFLIGLFAGRALALAAMAIFALSLVGYFFAGDYLQLWAAGIGSGSMIAGAFWLRR